MSRIELATLLIATVWLSVLSLLVILLIRQLGLVTVRLDANTFSLEKDGPEVGSLIPAEVVEKVPRLGEGGLTYVLTLGATCTPCRELVDSLRGAELDEEMIALLGGAPEVNNKIAAMLPPTFPIVQDPLAHQAASALSIQSTPFVIEVLDSVVTGRAYIRDLDELNSLIRARSVPEVQVTASNHQEEARILG